MRRSKQELYIDVLKLLIQRGPMRFTHLMGKANLNAAVLRGNLNNLIKSGLVEQKLIIKKRKKPTVIFSITQKGNVVLKIYSEFMQMMPTEVVDPLQSVDISESRYEDVILSRYGY